VKANLESQSPCNLNDACIGQDPAEPCRIDATRTSPGNTGAGIAEGWSVHDIDSICTQLKCRLAVRDLEAFEERHVKAVEARSPYGYTTWLTVWQGSCLAEQDRVATRGDGCVVVRLSCVCSRRLGEGTRVEPVREGLDLRCALLVGLRDGVGSAARAKRIADAEPLRKGDRRAGLDLEDSRGLPSAQHFVHDAAMIEEMLPLAKGQIVLRREGEAAAHVGVTGAVLEHQTEKCGVSGLASVGSLDGLHGIVEAVRPCVTAEERQAVRIPLFNLRLQRIVIGYALVGNANDVAEVVERLIKLAIPFGGNDARILVRAIADPQVPGDIALVAEAV